MKPVELPESTTSDSKLSDYPDDLITEAPTYSRMGIYREAVHDQAEPSRYEAAALSSAITPTGNAQVHHRLIRSPDINRIHPIPHMQLKARRHPPTYHSLPELVASAATQRRPWKLLRILGNSMERPMAKAEQPFSVDTAAWIRSTNTDRVLLEIFVTVDMRPSTEAVKVVLGKPTCSRHTGHRMSSELRPKPLMRCPTSLREKLRPMPTVRDSNSMDSLPLYRHSTHFT